MAILAECPRCHKKQAARNRLCDCGADLVKEKQRRRVRYWVVYRLADGRQRKEFVRLPNGSLGGIEKAQAAEGKRKAQKIENPAILERVPTEGMTFADLIDWYLNLSQVKKLASYPGVKSALVNINNAFGDRIVSSLKPLDIEEYQGKREEDGRASATIDMEVVIAKTMVIKAFDNDTGGRSDRQGFQSG